MSRATEALVVDLATLREGLTRPLQAPPSQARGYVELRRREKDGRDRFEVEAERLPSANPISTR